MTQAEFKKRLKALMNKPDNQVCSDCPERKPTWASLIVPPPGSPPGSLPIGAFCCLECSGSHRRLGVHISFVRSVNLDSWKEKEVLAMENGGNKKVNTIFEARLARTGARKPTTSADGPTRERFIRDKYERRKYYDETVLMGYNNTNIDNEDAPETSSSEDGEAPVRRRRVTAAAPRPQSEAARRRIQSRQGRTAATNSLAAAAPAPPPAPVDLLDFATFDMPAAPVASAATVPVASPASDPNVDLFAAMTVAAPAPTPTPAPTPVKPATKSNDDILAMFGAPPQQPPMTRIMMMPNSNNGMTMPISGHGMGMPHGNGFPMMQQQQQQQQTQVNPMMQQQQQPNAMMMTMMNTNPQVMNGMMNPQPTPQQQQQNMMFAGMQKQPQPGMMMSSSSPLPQPNGMGMPTLGMQQQQQQPSTMMMQPPQTTEGSFGFPDAPMGTGPAVGGQYQGRPMMTTANGAYATTTGTQQQQQATAVASGGGGDDPFAQFGVNVFRS